MMTKTPPVKVVELFAGVGGFRAGLEAQSSRFQTVWANQWEPGKKTQYAFDCYVRHFGASDAYIAQDIALVKGQVPDHDLLVGGFPCQDYSVAHTGAQGIEGKKGVLWWDINDIVKRCKPSYVLLENVDRLLKSPSNQRGRDFGVILRCFADADYAVEWRVINAADYGQAQRRRRTFIFAYHKRTPLYKKLTETVSLRCKNQQPWFDWMSKDGFFPGAFPVQATRAPKKQTFEALGKSEYEDLAVLSASFKAPFYNAGLMLKGRFYTEELTPHAKKAKTLESIRLDTPVDPRYYLNGSTEKWTYLKGAKKIDRVKPNGEPYQFSEGGMCFPDDLKKPSRTMLTSESTVNRSSHVIQDAVSGRLRLLTPVECERLNGFPDDWTNTGMPERARYFTMGNALVVPLVTKMGKRILEIL